VARNFLTKDQWLEKANLVHGNKYDYSLVDYLNSKSKVKIICSKHGIFEQVATEHTRGKGCRKCAYEKNGEACRLDPNLFIKKCKEVHNIIYDYSKVEYINAITKVEIICKKHGSFLQRPDLHLSGSGCPRCMSSKGEIAILSYLKCNDIKFIHQKQFDNCKNKIKLRFDFYLPEQNTVIEFDGTQHYYPTSFSSDKSKETMDKNLQYNKERDKIKTQYCLDNNIRLIRIPYWKVVNVDKILSKQISVI
jgi:very-short-patch-repair endonuclease